MQPNARIAAAIEILDSMLSEQPVERCLTTWARTHRFAGSNDRAAIRDAVFDAVRCQRSYAWLGGGLTGRGLMIGAMRAQGEPLDAVFTGQGHAPSELTEAEHAALPFDASDMPEPVRLDCPDWLWPMVTDAYPEMAVQILQTLQTRAPVFLRVNRAKATRSDAIATLAEDEIEAAPHKLSDTALEVTEGARRLRNARAYRDGLVELQDAASQAVVDQCLALGDSPTALDYCAGGGGKALALAAGGVPAVTAHDANPGRMSDLPDRAARAGATITNVETVTGTFDLVLCDAPCSGSGAWRRQPEGKWTLDAERLAALTKTQDGILDTACHHVAPGGALAYATCSLFPVENHARAAAFVARHPEWRIAKQQQWTPRDGGDGFFLAIFRRV